MKAVRERVRQLRGLTAKLIGLFFLFGVTPMAIVGAALRTTRARTWKPVSASGSRGRSEYRRQDRTGTCSNATATLQVFG